MKLCMTLPFCIHEIRATSGKKPSRQFGANKPVCASVGGVCQSESSLVGGGQDTDVKYDTVTAGKFTLPPPSAHTLFLSLSASPPGIFWLACG